MRNYRYKKPYRIKRKKSILRSRFFWPAVLVILATGGVLYFLFFSGIFQIKKIIITGDQIVSEDNIKTFVPQGNIFLIDIKKIERDILDNFAPIAKVGIVRTLPNTLNVWVAKRLPIAVWCEQEKCFWVDGEAVIFGEASQESGLINVSGVKEMLNKERVSQIMEIQQKLEEGLGITTTQAFIATGERLNIKTFESWEIYFNLKGDLNWQITELGLVLEKQITPEKRKKLEYIDLRFSRVYYK